MAFVPQVIRRIMALVTKKPALFRGRLKTDLVCRLIPGRRTSTLRSLGCIAGLIGIVQQAPNLRG